MNSFLSDRIEAIYFIYIPVFVGQLESLWKPTERNPISHTQTHTMVLMMLPFFIRSDGRMVEWATELNQFWKSID